MNDFKKFTLIFTVNENNILLTGEERFVSLSSNHIGTGFSPPYTF